MTATRYRRTRRGLFGIPCFFLLLAQEVFAAEPVPVSVCGTVVGERQVAILTADLDCGTLVGVTLRNRARLLMDGHRIVTFGDAVVGELDQGGRVSVWGPGEISSCARGIVLTGSDPSARRRVEVRDLSILRCGLGVGASHVRIRDSRIEGGDTGIYSDFGTVARNVTSIGHSKYGMVTPYRRVRGRNLTVTDNGWTGILARGVSLRSSTVTGNDTAFFGIDIATTARPRLREVTCGRSAQQSALAHLSGPPWGVCAND